MVESDVPKGAPAPLRRGRPIAVYLIALVLVILIPALIAALVLLAAGVLWAYLDRTYSVPAMVAPMADVMWS